MRTAQTPRMQRCQDKQASQRWDMREGRAPGPEQSLSAWLKYSRPERYSVEPARRRFQAFEKTQEPEDRLVPDSFWTL